MSYTTKENSAFAEECTVKGRHWIKNMIKTALNYAYWAKDAAATWTAAHIFSAAVTFNGTTLLKGLFGVKRTVATATDTATLTTAQMVTARHIDGTPTSAATYTTRTAAQLVAAISGAAVGTSYYLSINNKAGTALTITLAGGTGVTVDGTATIAQNVCRLFLVTFTNVTSGSEAVSIYGMGA